MAGVSSMNIGARSRSWLASTSLPKSSLSSWPRRSFSEAMPVRSDRIRVASCSADISSEKKATGCGGVSGSSIEPVAMWNAMLEASVDLPMAGRAARISRSEGCSPPSRLSISISPVE